MIFVFFSFLKDNNIDFSLINSYEDIINKIDIDSDIDILFKKHDFLQIEHHVQKFCIIQNIQIVQVLHHDLWAKNIFLYNPKDKKFLNLDLYGELSRKEIVFFKEKEIFNSRDVFENIPILSAEKEFIYYLIKKLDKDDLTQTNFDHLHSLYIKHKEACQKELIRFFPKQYDIIYKEILKRTFLGIKKNRETLLSDFYTIKKRDAKRYIFNKLLTLKRILNPTGLTISFLGPDGSGKSTIIDIVLETRLPFRRKDYFHLKPLNHSSDKTIVTDPHKYPPYSAVKSYIKLLYFIYIYNKGWLKNVLPLKIKSSLVIFDRYFDDLLVDNRRYRYSGSLKVAKLIRKIIPKPDIYFILTADSNVIYGRKQEVPFEEIERQTKVYEALVDGKRYNKIHVDRPVVEIVKEIVTIMMKKMHERY